MEIIKIYGDTTPSVMIEEKYERAKHICINIWDNPDKMIFEDIFHDTLYKCLITLGNIKYDSDYLKAYFFKAFRINMIRYYGYAYNKLNSGTEIESVIIPVDYNFDGHMDGFDMMNYVKDKYGEESHKMLWDNLCGMTYKELDNKYDVNSYYHLSKIKDELKKYYITWYEKRSRFNI